MGIIQEMYRKGVNVENEFILLAESNGYKCRKSTRNEDITEHWDVEITKNDILLKVDIKGLRKIDRNDSKPNQDYTWLEIKNVHGNVGWCYAEEVDGFFFELFDYWYYVDKKDVQTLIKEKIKKVRVLKPDDALYKLYQRTGRLDILTLVKSIDLLFYAKMFFKK